MDARDEWARDHRRDHADAARDARNHEGESPTYATTTARPTAPNVALHLVQAPATPEGLPGGHRRPVVASAPGAAHGRPSPLPVRPDQPLTAQEVGDLERAARFNRPISRVDVRRLCATVRELRRQLAVQEA